MKIAVDMGHCPKSTGASGNLNELKETRRIGAALIAELKTRGHSVVDVTPDDDEPESLSKRAKLANAAGCEFFVSIHLNAGGGTGTEAYTTANSGAKKQAAAISAAVAKCLGLKNRGHKTANYTVLVKTSMPAVLVEVCFVDRTIDAEAYNASSPALIAAAIAEGIDGVSGMKAPRPGNEPAGTPEVSAPAPATSSKKTNAEIAAEVIAGKWGNGADRKKRLQAAGYNYADVQAAVNAKLKGGTFAGATKSIDAVAREVIDGKWGNGNERKRKLTAAGYDYNTVQRRVNQLLK